MKERGRKEESREIQAELRATRNEKKGSKWNYRNKKWSKFERVCSNTDLKEKSIFKKC